VIRLVHREERGKRGKGKKKGKREGRWEDEGTKYTSAAMPPISSPYQKIKEKEGKEGERKEDQGRARDEPPRRLRALFLLCLSLQGEKKKKKKIKRKGEGSRREKRRESSNNRRRPCVLSKKERREEKGIKRGDGFHVTPASELPISWERRGKKGAGEKKEARLAGPARAFATRNDSGDSER